MPVRVSVCMATFNGARFVRPQVRTILAQLSAGDELIVSDDSSSDETLEIIESFGDNRIRIFGNQSFRSPVYNFEHALKQARGKWIFLSDQDDEWAPGWVEAALGELENASLVVSNAEVIDALGNTLPASAPGVFGGIRKSGVLRNIYKNGYVGCCCAFRREVLLKALPFPRNLPWHDWWMGLIADAFYKTKFLDQKHIRYRRHGSNFSPTGEQSRSTLCEKINMRYKIASALMARALD